jgi:hypothetical protein
MHTFGYGGDVAGVDITTFAFDEAQLVIMVDVIVPGAVERVRQLLSDEPTVTTLGPFMTGDVNVRTMNIRVMAHFPFDIMDFLLGANLTAHRVFEMVVPALIYGGLEETCSVLIDFLNMALVAP